MAEAMVRDLYRLACRRNRKQDAMTGETRYSISSRESFTRAAVWALEISLSGETELR
jgi:hypothetical protein